jgi:FKBP-type peptidyl-prolyl cis-trans isomerase (trigger factor)
MNRLDKKSVWGPKLMPGTEPGKFCCDSGFLFSAIVDAIPTGILDQIDSIPIRRRKLEVTNELIETELFEQRLLFGSRESFSGEVAYGDEVTCNATLTVDGNDTPEFAIENFKLRIPNEGQLLAIGTFRCDEGEQLRGASVPGTISITLSDQQEKNATLVLEVTSAERITPCEVDEILKQYGTANETLLKAQIKLSLQRNFDRENNTIMRNQLFNYLAENITVPVSQRIIEGHWEDMCKGELEKNPEQTELEEDVKNELQEKAKTRTQRRVITSYFQEFFDLVISEEDVQHQISDIAESRRVRPEEVQEEFVSSDKMNVLGNLVMEKKIFDSLKDKMVFTDAT